MLAIKLPADRGDVDEYVNWVDKIRVDELGNYEPLVSRELPIRLKTIISKLPEPRDLPSTTPENITSYYTQEYYAVKVSESEILCNHHPEQGFQPEPCRQALFAMLSHTENSQRIARTEDVSLLFYRHIQLATTYSNL